MFCDEINFRGTHFERPVTLKPFVFTVHAGRCTGPDLLHPPRRHEVHARAHENPESDQEQKSRGEVHVGKASGASVRRRGTGRGMVSCELSISQPIRLVYGLIKKKSKSVYVPKCSLLRFVLGACHGFMLLVVCFPVPPRFGRLFFERSRLPVRVG